jgi:hypothetical protein
MEKTVKKICYQHDLERFILPTADKQMKYKHYRNENVRSN